MADFSEKELFESVPVPQAVATLAIPTVISQVVTMIYNLARTPFLWDRSETPIWWRRCPWYPPGLTC